MCYASAAGHHWQATAQLLPAFILPIMSSCRNSTCCCTAAAMQWLACRIPSHLLLLLLLLVLLSTAALQDTVTTATHPAAAGGSYTITINLPPANVSNSCHIFLLPGSLQLHILQDEGHLEAVEAGDQQQPAATGTDSSTAAGRAAGVQKQQQQQAASLQDSSTAAHMDAGAAAAAAASATVQPLQQQAVAEKGLRRADSAATNSRHVQEALQPGAAAASSAELELDSSIDGAAAGLAGRDATANPAGAEAGLDSSTAGTASGRSLQQFQYNLGVELGPIAVQSEDRYVWGAVVADNPVVAPRPGLDPAVQVASSEDYPVPIITLPIAGIVTLAAANPLQLDGSQSLAAEGDSIVSWAWAVRMISPQEVDYSGSIVQSDDSPTALITISRVGSYVLGLTVQSASGAAHFNNTALIVVGDASAALVQPVNPPQYMSQFPFRAPPPPPRPRPIRLNPPPPR
jgi:hypothetical protein